MKAEYACTQERFASETQGHGMTIIKNDGVNRHLRFKRPGSSAYWFDLITWDGRLCIDGDCGTYVFARLTDMFEFFRSGGERINPTYWAEKALSVAKHGGLDEWSESLFRSAVVQDIRDYYRGSGMWSEARQCFKVARRDVLSRSGSQVEAVPAIMDFRHERFTFQDFGEHRLTEFTFHYIWCCHAIVWGVEQFDKAALAASDAA